MSEIPHLSISLGWLIGSRKAKLGFTKDGGHFTMESHEWISIRVHQISLYSLKPGPKRMRHTKTACLHCNMKKEAKI